jgi:hypothetical protein
VRRAGQPGRGGRGRPPLGTGPARRPRRARAALAREGVVVTALQAYLYDILGAILLTTPEARALFAPAGALLVEGETFRSDDLRRPSSCSVPRARRRSTPARSRPRSPPGSASAAAC